MRNLYYIILFVFAEATAFAVTLQQAISSAQKNNIENRVSHLKIEQSRSLYLQYKSMLKPSVSLRASNSFGSKDNKLLFDENNTDVSLRLDQQIYSGGREDLELDNIELSQKIIKHEIQNNNDQIIKHISLLYFDLIRCKRQQENYMKQSSVLDLLLSDIKKRVKIGKSRQSELIAVKTKFRQLQAEKISLDSKIIDLLGEFNHLTGMNIRDLNVIDDRFSERVFNYTPVEFKPSTLPLVKIFDQKISVQKNEKVIIHAEGLPSVSVSGDYYAVRQSNPESKLNASLSATWVLYDGSKHVHELDQVAKITEQLKIQRQDYINSVLSDYHVLVEQFQLQKKVVDQTERALDLSEEDYGLLVEEARLDLISNIDLLRGFDSQFSLNKLHIDQIHKLKVLWTKIRVLTGDHYESF